MQLVPGLAGGLEVDVLEAEGELGAVLLDGVVDSG